MPHADRSNDVVHMLYGSSGMEDPVEKRTPSLVRLTKRQKAVLKGMPQPGWYMRRDPVRWPAHGKSTSNWYKPGTSSST